MATGIGTLRDRVNCRSRCRQEQNVELINGVFEMKSIVRLLFLVLASMGGPRFAEAQAITIDMVYFVPRDREPVKRYEEKIHWIGRLMESVVKKDLTAKGYQTHGPRFRRQGEQIEVKLIRGDRTAAQYSQNFAWKDGAHGQAIFQEVDRKHANTKTNMTFVFCETYGAGQSRKLWPGHIALAVGKPPLGGVCVFSSWILRDEFASHDPRVLQKRFFDSSPIRGRSALGDRGQNSPRADFMEDGVGGCVHELAHMFGLTHHSGNRPQRHLMAQGFRHLRWNVGVRDDPRRSGVFSEENAGMLMTSRFINPAVQQTDNEKPIIQATVNRRGSNLSVSIDASDETSLARITVIQIIPGGGRELIWSKPINETQMKRTISVVPRPVQGRAGPVTIQVIAIDSGGNFTFTPRLNL